VGPVRRTVAVFEKSTSYGECSNTYRRLEDAPLEEIPAECLSTSKTHLPSLTPRRPEACPQPATTVVTFLVSALPGRATGDARQSRQAHPRRRWSRLTHTASTPPAGRPVASSATLDRATDSAGVHSQTWKSDRTTRVRDSDMSFILHLLPSGFEVVDPNKWARIPYFRMIDGGFTGRHSTIRHD